MNKAKEQWEMRRPGKHSVYLLKAEEQIVYIGLTNDRIFHRLGSHSYSKDFNRVFIIECTDGLAAKILEAKMIKEHAPRYNKKIDNPEMIGLVGIEGARKILGKSTNQATQNILAKRGVVGIKVGEFYYYDRAKIGRG